MITRRRPRDVIPLDGDDHRAVVGLADGKPVEVGHAGDRRGVVQIGHDLNALLEGEGGVLVRAGRGLTDKCRLTGDVPELSESRDNERLRGGRNGVIAETGVRSCPETPILFVSKPRFISRSCGALLSRNVSSMVPVKLIAESAAPPTAGPYRGSR